MSFVVAGVSGHTGRVVAESLLERKQAVRVLVRDAAKGKPWAAKGAEVAVADLGDEKALTSSLRGAQGAYLLVPPSMTEPNFRAYQDLIVDTLTRSVQASGVPHVVLLSSVGAQRSSGNGPIAGLHGAERKLAGIAGTTSTFLRAGYFMENLGASLATLAQGFIPSFLPAALAIDMIATVDIGRVAASLLVERAPGIVELGGPPVSMNDVAAALGRITGKPVRVQEAPLDAVVPTFTGFGFPKDLAELYREMIDGISHGRVVFEGNHRRVLGTTSVETVLRGMVDGR